MYSKSKNKRIITNLIITFAYFIKDKFKFTLNIIDYEKIFQSQIISIDDVVITKF